MHLLNAACRHFRCLNDIGFSPSPKINVIHGDNGQGKTTLLESILYGATSKSHRTVHENDLPRYGADEFHVLLQAQRSDRDVTIAAHWFKGVKRFKVNGVSQSRVSDILGRLNVVLFSPEDVELVKGSGAARRRFLDMEISQVHPQYLQALQAYRRVLRQRNELLRTHNPDPDLLAVWDAQLVEHAAVLIRERDAYITELATLATEAYHDIAQEGPLTLTYRPDVADAEEFAAILAKGREVDIRRGMTAHGPHRDDIEILIANQRARSHASQGQQKTVALALKLAEVTLVKRRTGEFPILMLDEVLAELDPHRARRLFETLPATLQCLVTTTAQARLQEAIGIDCAQFHIQGGEIERQE